MSFPPEAHGTALATVLQTLSALLAIKSSSFNGCRVTVVQFFIFFSFYCGSCRLERSTRGNRGYLLHLEVVGGRERALMGWRGLSGLVPVASANSAICISCELLQHAKANDSIGNLLCAHPCREPAQATEPLRPWACSLPSGQRKPCPDFHRSTENSLGSELTPFCLHVFTVHPVALVSNCFWKL